jgi:hypothetical protein
MRASRINLTTTPQKFYEKDDTRGIFIIRNTDVSATAYVQFGSPGDASDGFPVLAGDTLTLDRGDLTPAIFLWAATANSNNALLVG